MSDNLNIRTDFSLLKYNTFGIDSIADRFIQLDSIADYSALVASGMLDESPFFILGGGSNVVLPDRYKGAVVHPANKGIRLIERRDGHCFVEAQAGEVWVDFVEYCITQGWYGLENLAGIPGSVGAAPVQNVGAYGKEAKDAVWRVHCFDIHSGEERWIDADECQFGYRWSRFKGEWAGRYLIDRVVFRLNEEFVPDLTYKALASALVERGIKKPTARQVVDTVKQVRDSKLPNPNQTGSAGSFFKNPIVGVDVYERLKSSYPNIVAFAVDESRYKLAAGWLIEQCGWKGRTLGRAGVYEKQALVLVNRGGCTGEDVRSLSEAIISDVETRFGVTLECEAIILNSPLK